MAEIVGRQRRQHHFERAKQMLGWFNDYSNRLPNDVVYSEFLLEQHFESVDRLIDKELMDG